MKPELRKKFEQEMSRRVLPFLPKIPQNNTAMPTPEMIRNNNDNLRYIDDETLMTMFNFDHSSIHYRLEGAMDQFDYIFNEMTDEARMELLYDYPELTEVISALHEYRRSPRTADSVKALYNMTRSLRLTARIFEYETPNEIQKEMQKEKPELKLRLENTFNVFYENELRMQQRFEEEKVLNEKMIAEQKRQEEIALQEQYDLEERLEYQQKVRERNEMLKKHQHHPYFISPRMRPTPFDN